MEVLQIILAIATLAAAIPAGIILRNYTKEEMKEGKQYFKVLWIASLIAALGFVFAPIGEVLKMTAMFGLVFIAIVSFISWKGK
jgi:lysylphosphatidylglycerol synthetase-like protein (DUF2156 family)